MYTVEIWIQIWVDQHIFVKTDIVECILACILKNALITKKDKCGQLKLQYMGTFHPYTGQHSCLIDVGLLKNQIVGEGITFPFVDNCDLFLCI